MIGESASRIDSVFLPEVMIYASETPDGEGGINLVVGIWCLGSLFMLMRILYGCLQILKFTRQTEVRQLIGRRVRLLPPAFTMPFSFAHLLFWPSDTDPADPDWQPIWAHECAHIDQGHTYDLIFMDLIGVVFWWHPLLWLQRSILRLQHELLADHAAISTSKADRNAYGRLLLLPRLEKEHPLKAHTFHQSFIKKRINMLHQSNGSVHKCWIAILLIPILTFACGQIQEEEDNTAPDLTTQDTAVEYASSVSVDTIVTFDPDTYEEDMQIVESVIYTEAEYFPIYGNCDDFLNDSEALHNCSFRNLMEELSKHLLYPSTAKELGIEGTSFLKLRVPANTSDNTIYAMLKRSSLADVEDTDALTEPEREAYQALDDAAMAAWNKIPKNDWQPARIGDEPVTMELTLPVRFALE
ncbi:MAG: M56 family metallopeptidase [Bacteroidota bacterium]